MYQNAYDLEALRSHALNIEMNAIIMFRLDKITKTLKELKSEYSNIKNVLGIGDSDSINSQELEDKSLRDIVEETQFQVKQINAKILCDRIYKEILGKTQFKSGLNLISADESDEEYPVVEIQRKTIQEERNWMKQKFNEIKKTSAIADGESLRGTNVESISSSIRLSHKVKAGCAMKLSNYLDSALNNPAVHFWVGSRVSGPSRVVGHQSEAISFVGDSYSCSFLYSFTISGILRLTIRCYSDRNGSILFGIAFTPTDIPTDQKLHNQLHAMPPVPDVWMNEQWSKVPVELFVSSGNLLVRGHMTPGPRSVVHVEIIEMKDDIASSNYRCENKLRITDGKSRKSLAAFKNSAKILNVPGYYSRFSCVIETVNCLSVTLRNRSQFYCKCDKNNFMPFQVLPFQREIFVGEDESEVEAMFSYEIDTTDVGIVVALKVGLSFNTFAAAFVHVPTATGAEELRELMDPRKWKTHDYRKYASGGDGVQLIQTGNIRAEIRMTEENQSLLKIRVYAV